jgi:hypothetical protein
MKKLLSSTVLRDVLTALIPALLVLIYFQVQRLEDKAFFAGKFEGCEKLTNVINLRANDPGGLGCAKKGDVIYVYIDGDKSKGVDLDGNPVTN